MITAEAFVNENRDDLVALGLFTARLLYAELCAERPQPSAVFAAIAAMTESGSIGTKKNLSELLRELGATGLPIIDDGLGQSILGLCATP